MSKNGENVLSMIRDLQKLNSEIAQFFKACDKSLAKRGFVLSSGNLITRDITTSINDPSSWVPFWFYRIYKDKARGNRVFCLNLALDYISDATRIKEPLAIGAVFDYVSADLSNVFWDPWNLYFNSGPLIKETDKVYSLADLDLTHQELRDVSKWDEKKIGSIAGLKIISTGLLALRDSNAVEKAIISRIL